MTQQRRLALLLLINLSMITGLVLVGVLAHSLSVLAAGGDFIADSLAIMLGMWAVNRRDKHDDARATTYVALVNVCVLLSITIFVTVQAVDRFMGGNTEVHGLPVLLVALISALAMALGVIVLGLGAGKEDLHMRAVLLDTISDGLAAVGVALVGAIITITHKFFWLDAIAAILISIFIAYNALRLLRDVLKALRSHTPLSLKKPGQD